MRFARAEPGHQLGQAHQTDRVAAGERRPALGPISNRPWVKIAALLGGSLLAQSQRCRALLSAAAPAATIHHTGNETKRFRVHLEGLGRQLVLG